MRPSSVGVSPAAAVLTTVFTVPTGYYAKFTVMYIHNTGGSTKHITVQWYDASTATTYDILLLTTLLQKSIFSLMAMRIWFWKKATRFKLLRKREVHSVL